MCGDLRGNPERSKITANDRKEQKKDSQWTPRAPIDSQLNGRTAVKPGFWLKRNTRKSEPKNPKQPINFNEIQRCCGGCRVRKEKSFFCC